MMFYDEGSSWQIISFAVLTLGALIFQIGAKYDKWKNPEKYEFDWKAELEEEWWGSPQQFPGEIWK